MYFYFFFRFFISSKFTVDKEVVPLLFYTIFMDQSLLSRVYLQLSEIANSLDYTIFQVVVTMFFSIDLASESFIEFNKDKFTNGSYINV